MAIGFVIILAIARGKSIEGIVLILLFGALILIAYMWVTDHILKPPGA